MQTLVKFCKPEHNLLDRCHNIRFGTLEYYREMDPSFTISDPDEGCEKVVVKSIETDKASTEAYTTIPPDLRAPYIAIKGINFDLTFPNCYIFCCSKVKIPIDKDFGKNFDPAYSSSYSITNPHIFAGLLANLLQTYIKRGNFADAAKVSLEQLSIGEMMGISIAYYFREVIYVDEKISTIEEGQLSPYIKEIPQQLRPIFVKLTKFSSDKEFRFVFTIQHKSFGILPVSKEPVDLPILPIATL